MTEENKTPQEELVQTTPTSTMPPVSVVNHEILLESNEEEKQIKEPIINKNFTQIAEFSFPIEGDFDYQNETAPMPSNLLSESKKVIDDIPNLNLTETQENREWVAAVNSGLTAVVSANGLNNTVLREGADFQQAIESDIGLLAAATPILKIKDDKKLSGEKARIHIRQALNLGSIFGVPLWHSGFWIRLKAPSEGDLLELYRQVISDKISLGRSTYGLLFSNDTSYISKAILDFCIKHVYDSSLSIPENDDIRNYIKTPDLPILFWGLTNAIYPNGFQYTRACVTDPEKCNYVLKERLDLSKLLWTDKTCLTKHQINHMTKRQRGSMNIESLKRYSEEFLRGQNKKIILSDKVSIIVKIPTSVEHIDAGYRWINAIEDNYGKALIQDETKRDTFLINQGKATMMRQYAHFVSSIEVSDESYDELETIENILNDLTADDKIRNNFIEKVAEYLDESVVSLVAIPTYKCPNCGGLQHSRKDNSRFMNLIPLEIPNTFFSLVLTRIRKIETR